MKTNFILMSAFMLLGITGCSSSISDEQIVDEDSEYVVHFKAGISLTQTKAASTENMGENVKARICAYTAGSATTGDPLVSKEYTADASGGLIATSQMYLAKGNYDFYGVSVNSTSATIPTFTTDETEVLENNVDYLWVKAANKTITSNPTTNQNIDLTFERKAVKILINIESGNGVELDSWQDSDPAMILPPDPSTTCKMTLSTGAIVPATSVKTTTVAMTTGSVDGVTHKTSASFIMLPLVNSNSLVPTVTLKVKVKINGKAAEDRTYEAELSYPINGFTSGNQYTYKATLKANGITFTGAKVTNWSVQDQSGTDLNPTEPTI